MDDTHTTHEREKARRPGEVARTAAPWVSATLAASLLFAAIGCKVGPDYKTPPTQTPPAWGEPAGMRVTTQPAQLAGWWKTFKDPVLDQIMDQAISGNISLRTAEARVREARAERGVVAADLWPMVSSSGSYQRFRNSQNAFSGTGGTSTGATTQPTSSQPSGFSLTAQNLYQVGFDASWEIDVFGKIRRNVEAADATVAAAQEDRRDVLVSLLAEVALNYVELRGFQRQIVIAKENLEAQRQTLALTRVRYEDGIVTDLDVAQAEAQVATTEAQIPPLETSVRQTMHMLSVLLGKEPMALSALADHDAPIPPPPPEVPAGIPSDLLRQRPDIRRAERQLAAATALIGSAVADLFPQFSLTGSANWESLKSNTLFNHNSLAWSFGPGVTWPVFDAWKIRSNIQVKNQQQREAADAYEQAVLTALQNVEDALVAYLKEQAHNKALAGAVEADRRALKLATDLYENGRTDFLSVLDAQRALYAAENSLVQSNQALSTDVVSLYKALGGGWQGMEQK